MAQEVTAEDRETYRRLVEWAQAQLTSGTPPDEVVKKLENSGYSRSFAIDLTSTVGSAVLERARADERDPTGDFAVAAIATGIGGGITYLTFAAANPGGTFLIFYGPAVYGAWRLLKGIIRFLRSADARTPTAWVMGATALAIAMLSVVGLIYATSNSETGSDATTRGGAPSRISTPPPTLDESLTNLKTGDCVKDPGESEFETLERTACGGGNVLRVINTFQITGHSDYPGTMRIAEIAEARCSYSATTYFEPTPGSWAVGDRLVVCVSD